MDFSRMIKMVKRCMSIIIIIVSIFAGTNIFIQCYWLYKIHSVISQPFPDLLAKNALYNDFFNNFKIIIGKLDNNIIQWDDELFFRIFVDVQFEMLIIIVIAIVLIIVCWVFRKILISNPLMSRTRLRSVPE
jgi:UDP-glucose 6-dehydrogenase